jgi:hypothetical protein
MKNSCFDCLSAHAEDNCRSFAQLASELVREISEIVAEHFQNIVVDCCMGDTVKMPLLAIGWAMSPTEL